MKSTTAYVLAILVGLTVHIPISNSAAKLDFDEAPQVVTGPSIFLIAQPIDVTFAYGENPFGSPYAGVFGGTVLTNATYLPYAVEANLKSVYGTADTGGDRLASPLLQNTLEIICQKGCTSIEGLLLNGMTRSIEYEIEYTTSTSGPLPVWNSFSRTLLRPNFQSGMSIFRVKDPNGLGIIGVRIRNATPSTEWDFFVDSLAFDQSFEAANASNPLLTAYVIAATVPEPSAIAMLLGGLVLLIGLRRRVLPAMQVRH